MNTCKYLIRVNAPDSPDYDCDIGITDSCDCCPLMEAERKLMKAAEALNDIVECPVGGLLQEAVFIAEKALKDIEGTWAEQDLVESKPLAEKYKKFLNASGDWKPCENICPKCGKKNCQHRIVTSSDEAFDDEEIRCSCGYSWRVDGIDS